jgi:hypothetical protein
MPIRFPDGGWPPSTVQAQNCQRTGCFSTCKRLQVVTYQWTQGMYPYESIEVEGVMLDSLHNSSYPCLNV